jgi:hypothetical protein
MKKGFSWLGSVVLTLALAGCGGGGGGGGGSADYDPAVFFVAASPDAGKLTWAIDGKVLSTPQSFLQGSGTFAKVSKDGDLDTELFEQGNPESFDSRVIKYTLNESTLLLAVGFKNFGTEFEKRLKLHRFVANRSTPNGNRARVYFFHGLMFEAGFFLPSIRVQSPGKTPQYVTEDMALGNASEIGMDAGVQEVVVRRTGTEKDYLKTKLNLVAGKVFLGLVTGVVGRAGADKAQIKLIELPTRD